PVATAPEAASGTGDVAAAAHAATARVLETLRDWSAEERFAASRLVVVTRGASDGADPAAAAVWGLVRAAQAENPGRFTLLDLEPSATSPLGMSALRAALASGEPQLALREDRLLAPRLVRAVTPAE
ncbi:hypothetical protein CWI85_14060, partial [Streptomyces albidoflavus]